MRKNKTKRSTHRKPRKRQSTRIRKLKRKWEHKKSHHKPKKVGARVSYKTSTGKRVSGKVVGKHKEYYVVKRKNKIYKVNRRSVLYQIGHAIKGVVVKARGHPYFYRRRKGTKKTKTTPRQRYLRGKLIHEGYYDDEAHAHKVAKKHNGYIKYHRDGLYAGSYEVFAPIPITSRFTQTFRRNKNEGP